MLSQEAYILFYAKQGTPWFSSLMETMKASLDPYIPNNSPNSVLDNMDHISISSPNVSNKTSCEANEASEDGFGIHFDFINGGMHDNVQVSEGKDVSPTFSSPVPQGTDNSSSGTSCNPEKMFLIPEPQGTQNSSRGMSCNAEKKISPSVIRDYTRNHNSNELEKSANITLLTPPRSSSPDIYAEEVPSPGEQFVYFIR